MSSSSRKRNRNCYPTSYVPLKLYKLVFKTGAIVLAVSSQV